MRKLILGAAVATFLAGSAAFAAEIKATITHIDVQHRIIVIDGRAFHVGAEIDITILKVGEVVTIEYTSSDGHLTIVSIKVD